MGRFPCCKFIARNQFVNTIFTLIKVLNPRKDFASTNHLTIFIYIVESLTLAFKIAKCLFNA